MRCNRCGTESTTGKKFCAACGSPLSSRCPKCGAENAPSSTFCEDCGAALAGHAASAAASSPQVAPPEQPADAPLDGERKTVTALFADIKGSTEMMEDLDPEEARAIVDPALKLMIDAAHRYDGYVVQSTGDGIFALFGAPVAHEDHPQRALYAALTDAGGVAPLFGEGGCRWRNANRSARRGEHGRGGGALDHDRRGTNGVHADRAYDQPRLADAGAGADRVHRDQ